MTVFCCCFSHTGLATGITVPEYTSNPLTSIQLHLHSWCYKSERDLITARRDKPRTLLPCLPDSLYYKVSSSEAPCMRRTHIFCTERSTGGHASDTSSSQAGCPTIVPREHGPRKQPLSSAKEN